MRLKALKGKHCQPRTLYPAKLSFRIEEERKIFPDKQNEKNLSLLDWLYKKYSREFFKLKQKDIKTSNKKTYESIKTTGKR